MAKDHGPWELVF